MHRALGILNYVIGDYPLAVSAGGEILNDFEYQEQITLLSQVHSLVARRSSVAAEATVNVALLEDVAELQRAAEEPIGAGLMLERVREVRDQLVATYELVLAPRSLPSVARGRQLYGSACAVCHGCAGRGRTPTADQLDPRPKPVADHSWRPRRVETFEKCRRTRDGRASHARTRFHRVASTDDRRVDADSRSRDFNATVVG